MVFLRARIWTIYLVPSKCHSGIEFGEMAKEHMAVRIDIYSFRRIEAESVKYIKVNSATIFSLYY